MFAWLQCHQYKSFDLYLTFTNWSIWVRELWQEREIIAWNMQQNMKIFELVLIKAKSFQGFKTHS